MYKDFLSPLKETGVTRVALVCILFSNGPNNSLKADEAAGTDVTVHVTKNGERVIVALNLKYKNY